MEFVMGKQVVVAGAGPAGMMAAVKAAEAGARVTLLEGMRKPGKKLLLTGNGRCNLTNFDPLICEKYLSDQPMNETERFVSGIISRFDPYETTEFFRKRGLPVISRAGWVYPRSGQAQSVLRVMLSELERLHVRLKYNAKAESLQYDRIHHKWRIQAGGWDYEADSVILACGSSAAPETGSDGSGYDLARSVGIGVTPVSPVLTGMIVDDPDIAAAKGARTPARISLLAKDRVIAGEEGELQWTEYGISGIAVFQLTRFLRQYERKEFRGIQPRVRLDLVPDMTKEEVMRTAGEIARHYGSSCTAGLILKGFTHERAAAFLEKKISPSRAEESAESLALKTACALKETILQVKGVRSFDHAQTASGGIAITELEPGTLEAKGVPGLFFAGEIVDIDGPCGGYNLQWAWSSGSAAGTAAARDCQSL